MIICALDIWNTLTIVPAMVLMHMQVDQNRHGALMYLTDRLWHSSTTELSQTRRLVKDAALVGIASPDAGIVSDW